MIQICCHPNALPLMLVFEMTLKEEHFSHVWKKANEVPVHKKEKNNLLKNPISLLLVLSKAFLRIIYNFLFNHFIGNKLFTLSQHSFLKDDSRVVQLMSIIYGIQTNFDSNPFVDVRGAFLDISKVLDKVRHEGLLLKLKSYSVEGELPY